MLMVKVGDMIQFFPITWVSVFATADKGVVVSSVALVIGDWHTDTPFA